MKEEKYLDIYGGLREGIGMKTSVQPNGLKTLKLRFRVGDLDLPERRKRHTSSRDEEDVAINISRGVIDLYPSQGYTHPVTRALEVSRAACQAEF